MSEASIAVFKILIKVPAMAVFICLGVNFLIFSVCYMRVYSVANEAVYTAVENNYIPPDERILLEKQMYGLSDGAGTILQNMRFTPGTSFTRQQYGKPATVGVTAHYVLLLPFLDQSRWNKEGSVSGMTNSGSTALTTDEIDAEREKVKRRMEFNITIEQQVIGLNYYPDLEN